MISADRRFAHHAGDGTLSECGRRLEPDNENGQYPAKHDAHAASPSPTSTRPLVPRRRNRDDETQARRGNHFDRRNQNAH
jgi:hypothetical protein